MARSTWSATTPSATKIRCWPACSVPRPPGRPPPARRKSAPRSASPRIRSLGRCPGARLCAQHCGFNLHAATRVAGNDKTGRQTLCRYILRPPLANDRLQVLPDGSIALSFKRPWSDGTTSVALAPLALIARLAAIVPPPRRHVTRYFGVLSSHSKLRRQVVPVPGQPPPVDPAPDQGDADVARRPARSRYIPWAELLRRTWGIDVLQCHTCGGRLRLIALVKTEATIKKILGATGCPPNRPSLIPPAHARGAPGSWWRRGQPELIGPRGGPPAVDYAPSARRPPSASVLAPAFTSPRPPPPPATTTPAAVPHGTPFD
jgi:putative transposase